MLGCLPDPGARDGHPLDIESRAEVEMFHARRSRLTVIEPEEAGPVTVPHHAMMFEPRVPSTPKGRSPGV